MKPWKFEDLLVQLFDGVDRSSLTSEVTSEVSAHTRRLTSKVLESPNIKVCLADLYWPLERRLCSV